MQEALEADIPETDQAADDVSEEMMALYAAEFPGYGFATNVGYGSAEHLRALGQLGPTPIHRKSFRPVRDCIEARGAGQRP